MLPTSCQSREICLARVTVQFVFKSGFDQNYYRLDRYGQRSAVCASLHAGFEASMHTISKYELYVALSFLSVVVKLAQNRGWKQNNLNVIIRYSFTFFSHYSLFISNFVQLFVVDFRSQREF